MVISFRSALLILAAASASSVAPAQVGPDFVRASGRHDCFASEDRACPEPTRYSDLLDGRRRSVRTDHPRRDGPKRRRSGSRSGEADRRSFLARGAAPRLRSRQPRARVPCRRDLFRIEERAACRPARRWRSHRQSRQFERPLPVDLLRRAVPARPVQLHSRQVAGRRCNASGRQWQNAVAIAKIVDQDLKDSAVGNALFFHAKHVSPRWRLKRVASVGNHVFYR